jgi:hypothetical protein
MSRVIATLVNLASIGLMAFTIYRTLSSFRQERPLSKGAQYVAMVFSTLTLVVYLVGTAPGWGCLGAIALAGLLGAVLGSLWSRTTKLTLRQGRVVGRNTAWWLVFWGASFIVTQSMTLLRRRIGLDISLVLMAFSTGVAVTLARGLVRGIDAALVRASAETARQTVPAAPSSGVGQASSAVSTCENCGSPVPPDSVFCEQCGQRLH